MATSIAEYLTSIWNHESGIIALLFILFGLLATVIASAFCIHQCCSRRAYEHETDLEKAIDVSTARSEDPGRSPVISLPDQTELPTAPRQSQNQPRYLAVAPTPTPTTCTCRITHGACHSGIAKVPRMHALAHAWTSRPQQGEPETTILETSYTNAIMIDHPPSYDELMIFGKSSRGQRRRSISNLHKAVERQ